MYRRLIQDVLAPHLWLADGASLYDHFGPGFTLLVTEGNKSEAANLIAVAAARRIPLVVVAPEDSRLRGRYEARFALIRPDQHVAWRGDVLPADCDALLAQVTGHTGASLTDPDREAIESCQRVSRTINTGKTSSSASGVRADAAAISPCKLAHVVFRTSRYRELIAWYQTVLNAQIAFSNDVLTFLSYDEEHHRVAVINMPDLQPRPTTAAGLHHVAFTFATLADLMNTYVRLRDLHIIPVFVINHGPTTSLYYEDPDNNNIELQIDNYDRIDDAAAFFYSDAFAENPVGVEFDPEVLLARFAAGEPEAELKRRPNAGPKGLSDIKLR